MIDRVTPVETGWHEDGCLYQKTIKTLFCEKCEKVRARMLGRISKH